MLRIYELQQTLTPVASASSCGQGVQHLDLQETCRFPIRTFDQWCRALHQLAACAKTDHSLLLAGNFTQTGEMHLPTHQHHSQTFFLLFDRRLHLR